MKNSPLQIDNEPQSGLSKFMTRLALFTLFIAGILIVYLVIALGKTNYKVRETTAYTTVTNCIVARLASNSIKQDEIEDCYKQVEMSTDISLQRFDKQTKAD